MLLNLFLARTIASRTVSPIADSESYGTSTIISGIVYPLIVASLATEILRVLSSRQSERS